MALCVGLRSCFFVRLGARGRRRVNANR